MFRSVLRLFTSTFAMRFSATAAPPASTPSQTLENAPDATGEICARTRAIPRSRRGVAAPPGSAEATGAFRPGAARPATNIQRISTSHPRGGAAARRRHIHVAAAASPRRVRGRSRPAALNARASPRDPRSRPAPPGPRPRRRRDPHSQERRPLPAARGRQVDGRPASRFRAVRGCRCRARRAGARRRPGPRSRRAARIRPAAPQRGPRGSVPFDERPRIFLAAAARRGGRVAAPPTERPHCQRHLRGPSARRARRRRDSSPETRLAGFDHFCGVWLAFANMQRHRDSCHGPTRQDVATFWDVGSFPLGRPATADQSSAACAVFCSSYLRGLGCRRGQRFILRGGRACAGAAGSWRRPRRRPSPPAAPAPPWTPPRGGRAAAWCPSTAWGSESITTNRSPAPPP